MKIEINHWDLLIGETNNGEEVVRLAGRLAFDENFIKELKEMGVKKYIQRDENGDNEVVD